ncbi:MAG TPA: inorganic phosphate transporter [Melioribacteraceae bacterium]|nr:inorganic phosphate transporter [Melioribacteraceae bacterium]
METYLFLVIILFVLATSDLVVGVANDAVNFLNSSLGSKVAPRHIILIVASLGVVVGTLFSSGMMEVARSGFFNPTMFTLNEVMVIFLGVMFTDVLLLDLFNTFGLPTSTTVSLVSSLLGGSVVMGLVKLGQSGRGIEFLGEYINTGRALGIFSAILLSVVVSFTAGAIVQYLSRLIFTYNFEKTLKRYGALWGAVALTSITYFIFVKGAKGTTFLSPEMIEWIATHTLAVLGISFVFWTIILQLFLWFTEINILKPIVLVGTFSLALAFAANDLVNFIGVPLAGLSSYQIASQSSDPLGITMDALLNPDKTNSAILILAGLIMVATLWFNKKARTVTKTEINLGRQFDGYEKFESSALARNIVRLSLNLGQSIKKIIPDGLYSKLEKRFDTSGIDHSVYSKKDRPAFDFIRATVNLMVASSLISLGTAYKLPLSTTYVTFMVAMSSSFADKAWGRESAVYRVSGVLTVIAGWFLTAFLAFTSTSILALMMYYGGLTVTILIVVGAMFFIIRSNVLHTKREKKSAKLEAAAGEDEKTALLDSLVNDVKQFLSTAHNIYDDVYSGLVNENRKKLKKAVKETKELDDHGSIIMSKILQGAVIIEDTFSNEDLNLGKTVSSVREVSASLHDISKLCYEHVDNNHSGLSKEQREDFKELKNFITAEFDLVASKFAKKDLSKLEDLQEKIHEMKKSVKKLDRNQMIRIRKGSTKIRTNLLFMNILFKTESISENVSRIIDFNKELLKKGR